MAETRIPSLLAPREAPEPRRMSVAEGLACFAFYSVLGWAGDTAVRSLRALEWTSDNGLGLPFSPLYGFGALAVITVDRQLQGWRWWSRSLVHMGLLASIEYLAGVLSLALHGRRLWDYSDMPLNLHGHTDLLHALVWAVVAWVLTRQLHPRLLRLLPHWLWRIAR